MYIYGFYSVHRGRTSQRPYTIQFMLAKIIKSLVFQYFSFRQPVNGINQYHKRVFYPLKTEGGWSYVQETLRKDSDGLGGRRHEYLNYITNRFPCMNQRTPFWSQIQPPRLAWPTKDSYLIMMKQLGWQLVGKNQESKRWPQNTYVFVLIACSRL